MIDVSKIKIGDEVTVRAKVVETDCVRQAPVSVRIKGGSLIYGEDIITHTPATRPFKPGDMATWGACGEAWEFVTAANGMAFLKHNNGDTRIVRVSDLRHADEGM